ncbi:hypothetical protein CES86_0405 [Brucella lupini]|uniref:Uncharacterized protein n=1 Tax=Brucella lupini TaxID=255457 RepID=A0A256GYS5_9HYPH|nr:hypothetical protein CES86_0405 [Brucella lupini]
MSGSDETGWFRSIKKVGATRRPFLLFHLASVGVHLEKCETVFRQYVL